MGSFSDIEGLVFVENLHHFDCSMAHGCSRAEDASNTGIVEEFVVLSRDYTSCDDEDVFATEFLDFVDYLWNESLMTSCK